MNTMLERCTLLERRIASLEGRRGTTGQRAVRTGPLAADPHVREETHGEGSQTAPIILDMDDEEQLRQGLPPSPGPRPGTPIPGLGRVSPPPIPVPPPWGRPGLLALVRLPHMRRLTSVERACWLHSINSDEDDLYR
jgi:hypothetical protein